MPNWIEFHDSRLLAVRQTGTTCELGLDAYVHRWDQRGVQWQGTGWIQAVRMVAHNAEILALVPSLPADIADGHVRSRDTTHDNLLPLPVEYAGDFKLSLQCSDGRVFDMTGVGLEVYAVGEARFVEVLPEDMRPNAG